MTKRQGFASLSEERRRQIAAKGGRTAHAKGRAHRFTRQEAKLAGQKGGKAKRSTTPSIEGVFD